MTLIPGDKVVSIQTASGPVLVQAGASLPGDKGVTVQTAAGPVFLPVHTLIPGDVVVSMETDGGTVLLPVVAYPHWTTITTTLPAMTNHATVVFPDGKIVVMYGNKVYRSDDTALTWVEYTQTYYSGPNRKAVLLTDGTIVQQMEYSVYTSNDYGQTWTLKTDAPLWQTIASGALSTNGTTVYYVGGIKGNHNKNTTYVSTDKGASWSLVSTTAPFIERYNPEVRYIGAMLVLVGGVRYPTEYSATTVFFRDCWTSGDGGVTWNEITSNPIPFDVYHRFYGDAAYHSSFASNGYPGGHPDYLYVCQELVAVGQTLYYMGSEGWVPSDPYTWYANAFGYYASYDFGASWVALQNSYPCGTDPTGWMYGHTTNTLPDGRVILIGGYYNGAASNRVNIFRP